jgi:hypothetical protein
LFTEEQIENAKNATTTSKITPQTIIRKWELTDTIKLTLHEVEGIAYGLLITMFQLFTHMYKAADRHVETLTKS